ncbi:hypothetical protein AAG906_012811 [Vitis piasezkii]
MVVRLLVLNGRYGKYGSLGDSQGCSRMLFGPCMVFSICGQSVGEFRVDCTSIELQPVQVMDWQQNEAFIHAYCLVSPCIRKMQPTHFE